MQEPEFLQKKNSQWQMQKKFKHLWNNKKVKLFLIVSFLFLLIMLLSSKSVFTHIDLKSKNDALEQRLLRDSIELQSYRDTINALKNGNAWLIEKYARENFNMSKPNETVFKLVPNTEKKNVNQRRK
jgi:cell division protein FtsB